MVFPKLILLYPLHHLNRFPDSKNSVLPLRAGRRIEVGKIQLFREGSKGFGLLDLELMHGLKAGYSQHEAPQKEGKQASKKNALHAQTPLRALLYFQT